MDCTTTCEHPARPDDLCPLPTEPHSDKCAAHQDYANTTWDYEHEETECCAVHCHGADHTHDGERLEAAA